MAAPPSLLSPESEATEASGHPSSVYLLSRAGLAVLAGFGVLALWLALLADQLGWLGGVLLAAATAFAMARGLGLPSWWCLIAAAVWPAAVLVLRADWTPAALFLLLLALLLVFGASFQSRVPLWLSGGAVRSALIGRLRARRPGQFLDLGGGLAGPALAVARGCPGWVVSAVEWAPLPWLIGALRLRLAGAAVDWRRCDFWRLDFAAVDCVYAYLSPAPMARLLAKCRAEMRPGSELLSYRFAVPGQPADQVIELADGSPLYIWRF